MYISQGIIPAILDASLFLGISIVMVVINWKLSILAFLILPVIFILSKYVSKVADREAGEVIKLQQEMNSYNVEFFTGLKTIQLFNQEKGEREYQSRWINKYRSVRNRTSTISSFSNLVVDLGKAVGLSFVFAYGAWEISRGNLTIGSLIAFTVYFPQLFGSLQSVQFAVVKWAYTKEKIKLVYEILNLNNEVSDYDQNHLEMQGDIKFRNVSFNYSEGRGSVNGLSFHIRPGEFVGIVGTTGSGKTTVLDLLMRFYEPQQGRILIDGVDISELSHFDLRRQISMVPQDVFLWNKSIKENLLYANPYATKEQLEDACKNAQILDFIKALPEQWETIVGERGIKLSGGEKQRIGIARALLRDAKILLFDEPTSALDSQTESLLQKKLHSLTQGKTVMVVAHRLATIQNADRIIVMNEGKIVEIGTHDELMRKASVYYQLYLKQFHKSEVMAASNKTTGMEDY